MTIHSPIQLNGVSIHYGTKCCFEDFSTIIYPGQHIAIIGQNGMGKTSLLNYIIKHANCVTAHVPQLIHEYDHLSGGQKFNKALSAALTQNPDLLCLDEPTNHLDIKNRKHLMKMLQQFNGTLIMVTHDEELIEQCTDEIWHIYDQHIQKFNGNYQDYLATWQQKRDQIMSEISHTKYEKKQAHQSLMKEQQRASKSRAKGEKNITNRKYPTVTSHAKARRAEETSGNKKLAIRNKRDNLQTQLDELYLPEIIVPTFEMPLASHYSKNLIRIMDGACGYHQIILKNINFQMQFGERVAIKGNNGSGKSTLIKAILKNESISRSGDWQIAQDAIGFLDQHYAMIDPNKTVLKQFETQNPTWEITRIRHHLNQFLFKKNEQIEQKISALSGGEKARLCLSLIAATPPQLLILDEVTNNLDLETRGHIIEILNAYPGGLLVISHDENFLAQVKIEREIICEHGQAS